jgi:signal transduction histidine kinase
VKVVLRPLWRPTLLRRVLGALLLAFALIAATLLAHDFFEFKRDMEERPGVQMLARAMTRALAGVDNARDASLFLQVRALEMSQLRRQGGRLPGDIELALYDTDGKLAFATAGASRVTAASHWRAEASYGRWRLIVAEPRLPDASVLGWMGHELMGYLIIAFPLALVPLWIAVRRGMKPLFALANAIAQRDAQDLSPLGVKPRHDELKPLAAAFDALLSRLRAQLQRERDFVNDAAHELRTPMAVVATQAHLLVHAETPREREQAHAALDGALRRASHLTGQLLTLATLDEHRFEIAQRLDLASLVQQLLAQLAPRALESGLELSLDAPATLAAQLERAAFESVLVNLVDNALRYVPRGGRVEVSLAAIQGALRLCVEDDGPGIPVEQRDAAFERFWRGSGSEQTAGTGLGLAIVRRAAERLRGRVTLTHGLDGRGCKFTLEFPTQV